MNHTSCVIQVIRALITSLGLACLVCISHAMHVHDYFSRLNKVMKIFATQ